MCLHPHQYHLISIWIVFENCFHFSIDHRKCTKSNRQYVFWIKLWVGGRSQDKYLTTFPNVFGLCSVAITGRLKMLATLRARIEAYRAPQEPQTFGRKFYWISHMRSTALFLVKRLICIIYVLQQILAYSILPYIIYNPLQKRNSSNKINKFLISFSLIFNNITMIKLAELLQHSPNEFGPIVKANINNQTLMPLISDVNFLKKIEIYLISVEEAPFFIRHVFKTIRNPNERELNVLREFVSTATDRTLVELAEILLESASNDGVVSIEHFLKTIKNTLFQGENRETQVIARTLLQEKYEPIKNTILLLRDSHEESILDSQQYLAKLMKSLEEAFQAFSFSPNSIVDGLYIIGFLLKEKVTTETSGFSLLVLLFKLSDKYPKEIGLTIKSLRKYTNKEGIAHSYLCSAIFNAFSSHFRHELYYNTVYSSQFKLLVEISEKIYDLQRQQSSLSQMGWIGILSMNKWFKNDNIQDSYHICLSLLREDFFYKQELISEILILLLSNIIEQSDAKYLNKIEIILSALTAKEIKYLILKLNQSFTEQKKKVIIFASISQKLKILQTMAVFFAHSVTFDLKEKDIYEEYTYDRKEHWKSLLNQIDTSRYHTIQREIENLIQRNLFIINFQLDGMNAPSIQLSSQLRFYSNLLQNDEFSQGYWLNQEKVSMLFSYTHESLKEKIQILTDFIRQKKLSNASTIMLITQLLRQLMKEPNNHIDISFTLLIDLFVKIAFSSIEKEIFPSNLMVYLEFILVLLKLQFPIQQIESYLPIFVQSNIIRLLKKKEYSKVHYFVELIVLTIMQRVNALQNIGQHKECLTFYQEFILKDSSEYSKNDYTSKMCANYVKQGLLPTLSNFRLKEITAESEVRKMICHELDFTHIKSNIKKIGDVFKFQSPLFKDEIVVLTFLSNSPQDNYYLRNHLLPFLYQQYVRIFSLACQKVTNSEIHQFLFKIVIDLLQSVLVGDTSSHGETFYKTLNKIQLAYILLTKKNLHFLQCSQIRQIIKLCLTIVEKDNYPLLRQYIELILCRAYIVLNIKQPKNQMRQFFIDSMKVNINIGVPLVLTLGYELIDCCKDPQKYGQFQDEIIKIHEVILKFISCHTAYLRAICQYYFYLYLQIVQPADPFLVNIRKFWSEDKDSQKILKNVSMVVEGFRVGIQEQSDFLGFERVQEYPSNSVKLQIYASISKFYNEAVLNEIVRDQSMSSEYYDALCLAANERHQHLKTKYLEEFDYYLKYEAERTVKDNMKGKIKQEVQKVKVEAPKKNVDLKGKPKGKGKEKKKQTKQIQQVNPQDKHPINIFQKKYYELSKLKDFSRWSRINPSPKIIVIATLLQKVHNFGHILRTLHNNNAMIVVPSPQPLLHQQCKELVPSKCDVQIVQIRKKDLHKFIYLMKSLEYPLVALEQCSRSVMVQEAVFPNKFMLLLGNQRIGAPASLLNEGDLLVQIPQIGKIRSLNVHVSMVLCLWQYLSKQN